MRADSHLLCVECVCLCVHVRCDTHIGHRAHVITVNSSRSKQQQLFCVCLCSVPVKVCVLVRAHNLSLSRSLTGCWLRGTHCKSICVLICPWVCLRVCVCEGVRFYCTTLQEPGPSLAQQGWKGPRASSRCTPPTSYLSISHTRTRTHRRTNTCTQLVQPRYSAEGSHCSSDRRAPVKWLSLPGACVCVCVCFLPPMWLRGGEGRWRTPTGKVGKLAQPRHLWGERGRVRREER